MTFTPSEAPRTETRIEQVVTKAQVPAQVQAQAALLAAALAVSAHFGILHVGASFWLIGALTWGLVFIPRAAPWYVAP